MIGISGIFGNICKSYKYLELFKNIHKVNRIDNISKDYSNKNIAISLITRKELAQDGFENNFYEDEKIVIFIDGYICPENIEKRKNDFHYAKFTAELWEAKGINNFIDLNGEYNILIYEKKKKNLYIINDRFASRPLFYAWKDKTLFLGTEKKVILAANSEFTKFSSLGLMELFLFYHDIGDITIFKDVYSLPPASILKIEKNTLSLQNYWKLRYNYNKDSRKNDYTKYLKFLLNNAAKKRYYDRTKLGMGLSGGLDSRVIAATIPKDIISSIFVRTYGKKDSLEVLIAKKISEKLQFNHYIHEPSQVKFSRFLYPAVWRTEGNIPFIGLKSIIEHKYLKDKMYYNLGGHYGDVLTGKTLRPFMFLPLKKNKFVEKMFTATIKHNLNIDDGFKCIFNKSFFNRYFTEAKEHFIETYSLIEAENNCDLYNIWDMLHRQTRFTFNSSLVDNYVMQKIKLFTDYHYVDAFLKVPGYLRFGQVLYKKMIAKEFREINEIPNANSGVKLKSNIINNYIDLFSQYKAARKRIAIRTSLIKSDKYANVRNDMNFKRLIVDSINNDYFPSEIFSKKGLIKIVEEHYDSKKDYNYLVALLGVFIATKEMFVMNSIKSIPDKAEPFNI